MDGGRSVLEGRSVLDGSSVLYLSKDKMQSTDTAIAVWLEGPIPEPTS